MHQFKRVEMTIGNQLYKQHQARHLNIVPRFSFLDYNYNFYFKKSANNLVISEKCSTFAQNPN